MNCNQRIRIGASPARIFSAVLGVVAMALALIGAPARAAETSTGTIAGRVLNAENGKYLSSAVVKVDGTGIEAVTDDYGNFELRNVPAGAVTLTTTYSGEKSQASNVSVAAGQTTTQNIRLGKSGTSDNGALVLDAFQVQADRYKTAREIAINEERQSVNIKNVVAADAFGDIPSGNIGEFVKFLPGVQVSYGSFAGNNQGYSDSDASGVSIRGFGPEDTAILIDGMPVSNATPGTMSRQVGLDMLSINNASRVELVKVAMPDMPNNSAGGQINLITKSAFEYAKPEYTGRVFINFDSLDPDFDKTPGPVNKKTRKTTPGTELSATIPISPKFGLSVTGYAANEFDHTYRAQPILTTTGTFTNVAGQVPSLSNPILSRFQITDTPRITDRRSGNIKVDWKPTPSQTLSVNYQLSTYDSAEAQRKLDVRPTIAAGADWGPGFVNGTTANSTLDMTVMTRDRVGTTNSGQLTYTLNLGGWKVGVAGSYSVSRGDYEDREHGHFSEIDQKLNPGQVTMTGIASGVPGKITAFQRVANGGAFLDYTDFTKWGFDNILAKSGEASSRNKVGLYKVDIERDLDFIPWLGSNSLSFKAGGRRDQEKTEKWGLGTGFQEILDTGKTYLITDVLDNTFVGQSPGFGLPAQGWASSYKLFQLDQANHLFIAPADGSNATTNWNSYQGQQKNLTETTDAWYAMFNGSFFKNRLKYFGGVRQETKSRVGRGPFTDTKWNYAKLANGRLYTDTFYQTGVKLDGSTLTRTNADGTSTAITSFLTDAALLSRMTSAGVKYPDHLYGPTSTSLESDMLNRVVLKQVNEKIKGDPSASIGAQFDVTKKIAVKASWSRSFSLPALEDTTNGIVTGSNQFSINENSPVAADGTKGTITVANPGIMPSVSDNIDFEVSYYTNSGGKLSAAYYNKAVKNAPITFSSYSGTQEFDDVVTALGLNPADYTDWRLNTSTNSTSTQKTHGYEFTATQDFGFLGNWGRHFQAFASYSMKSLGAAPTVAPVVIVSPSGANVTLTPALKTITLTSNRFAGAGLQFTARRFSMQIRGTYRNANEEGQNRTSLPNGNFLRRFDPAEKRIDVNASYNISERYSFFISGRDVLNGSRIVISKDDAGLIPAYAQIFDNKKFGHIWTLGLNGRF